MCYRPFTSPGFVCECGRVYGFDFVGSLPPHGRKVELVGKGALITLVARAARVVAGVPHGDALDRHRRPVIANFARRAAVGGAAPQHAAGPVPEHLLGHVHRADRGVVPRGPAQLVLPPARDSERHSLLVHEGLPAVGVLQSAVDLEGISVARFVAAHALVAGGEAPAHHTREALVHVLLQGCEVSTDFILLRRKRTHYRRGRRRRQRQNWRHNWT
mmetsp:Transcript_18254/g.39231  ORF Transcript_18254/g.39231 Transcript_18254/m.39231 type:complete len:216 (-) Transcript_18254:35-682(-)